jgi:hypothetical protein
MYIVFRDLIECDYNNMPTKKYDDLEEAKKEARRLCEKHPKNKFYVMLAIYECVSVLTINERSI